MNYAKRPLTFEQQADLLIRRGMTGDRGLIISRLTAVNYYRLSAYWLPFRRVGTEAFEDGTSIEIVWDRYVFDRHLRLLVMDAIERIEIATRTHLAYEHAHAHGAFGYAVDPASLPKLDPKDRAEFLRHTRDEHARSKEQFVARFDDKYGPNHAHLPVWMATEIMAFGTILSFFRGVSHRVKKNVSSVFGMPHTVFNSWLLTMNVVRNICAHHARLWNRVLGVKPLIPLQGKYPDWHTPFTLQNDRIFAILTICRYCVDRVAPQSSWDTRVRALLGAHSTIPTVEMGFPSNWAASPIWAGPSLAARSD
jgi:abortive infection bacteriophage resistance protein